jgi:hypothetical protein
VTLLDAGAKAAAEATREARIAVFMVYKKLNCVEVVLLYVQYSTVRKLLLCSIQSGRNRSSIVSILAIFQVDLQAVAFSLCGDSRKDRFFVILIPKSERQHGQKQGAKQNLNKQRCRRRRHHLSLTVEAAVVVVSGIYKKN